ncbi:MAG TPA: hypothetical protein PK595_03840 [Bacteroidota bacterium]|jgi:hypothetical protein|nr:hypothetical protein [Bacteroidota bacterium]
MNTGQTMLTIAALTLLATMTLVYYSNIARQGRLLNQSQGGIVASTLATSYRERALNLYFDEAVKSYTFSEIQEDPSLLTAANYLGSDAGEDSVDKFDDVDDFNNFTDTLKLPVGTFAASFKVYYVSPSNIDVPVSSPTFLKRMDITVRRTFPPVDEGEANILVSSSVSCIKGLFQYDANNF